MTVDHKKALDLAREGKWDEAHQMIQSFSDQMSCLIHGYLHRVEGDLKNARYWYNRANMTMPENTLEEEINRIYELINTI
ncbi:MAG: hypothetical protein V3V22_00745 [Methylococcales bacterium]